MRRLNELKRIVAEMLNSSAFTRQEKFAYLLGIRSAVYLTSGKDCRLYRFIDAEIDKGVNS